MDNAEQHESRRDEIVSVAAKIGRSANALKQRVKRVEVEPGQRACVTTGLVERLKALERENNELREASVYFVQVPPDHRPRS